MRSNIKINFHDGKKVLVANNLSAVRREVKKNKKVNE